MRAYLRPNGKVEPITGGHSGEVSLKLCGAMVMAQFEDKSLVLPVTHHDESLELYGMTE